MVRFHAHASSSSGNLYTLTDGKHRLAIEAGVPWRQMQEMLGHQVTALEGVLVSHAHGDHARAVRDVLRAGVTAYASRETFEALGALGHHRAEVVKPLWKAQVGDWTVTPFDLRHDAAGALGFVVQSPLTGDRFLYACDTAYVPYRFAGLTMIAVEANYSMEILRSRELEPEQKKRVIRHHMSIERVVEMLRANDLQAVREIWLLHLSDGNSDETAFKDAVQRATGKPTYVAPRREGNIRCNRTGAKTT